MNRKYLCIIVCFIYIFASCSSAPKTPPQSLVVRNEAGRLVILGAKSLREGQLAAARDYYMEAYRLYTLVDDTEGRIRALDGLGRVPELDFNAWQKAQEIANFVEDQGLVALAALLKAEELLFSGEAGSLDQAKNILAQAITSLGNRPSDKARGLRLYGSVLKQLERYDDAIAVLKQAIEIDKKNKSFIELASDYYITASVYSKQGDYKAAVNYLKSAIEYDQRAENGSGLGSDYLALGTVYEKSGDLVRAQQNYEKALDIYTAGRFADKIESVRAKMQALR
ncbi:tetratricopeptide repeat protein [Gracilinema caldarium]|uniref:tetratricopeptide repeat protein n=1 Tax=Gracilinema caldarium TaxID=215591 RepID=UPI0026F2A2BB|nr:tetratricopeptide repeat protein [Gracilinema caldarium]